MTSDEYTRMPRVQRYLKFRVWDFDNNRFTFPSEYAPTEGEWYIGLDGFVYERHEGMGGDFEVENVDVNHFTGVQDSGDVDIYFFDHVRIKGHSDTLGEVDRVVEIADWSDVVADYGLENAKDAGLTLTVVGSYYTNGIL